MKIEINHGWQFWKQGEAAVSEVSIPHTVALEPLDVYKNQQGVYLYRKTVALPEDFIGLSYLYFEGVMTNCSVFVDGALAIKHFGGYLPFMVELTPFFSNDKREVSVEVEVDNRDDKNTPPGKNTSGLDFLYYGGIYRNVSLILKPFAHLTDAFEPGVANGGVRLISSPEGGGWTLTADVGVLGGQEKQNFTVAVSVKDGGEVLGSTRTEQTFGRGEQGVVTLRLKDLAVLPWRLLNAKLYTVQVDLKSKNSIIDTEIIEFGFRKAEVTKDGFVLNGEPVRLFGANRHQQYPYVGIAASDDAARREARLFGEMKINCLRLAHYPQSPAFLSECDRLGIVVIDCVPGWQYLGGRVWKKRLKENVIDMVKRDRNHASVMIYEVTPNETMYATKRGDRYIKDLADTVKRLLPAALTAGDTVGRRDAEFVGFDLPFSGEDKLSSRRALYANGEKKFFRREYGDWAFGGNNSTSRASRGDGERAMQVQAWNFQWTHNANYEENVLGDLVWEGIDHNRGYYPKKPLSTSGALDVFRLPKLTYGLLASQASASVSGRYVIFPAVLTVDGKTKLPVYSNCNELELRVNGKTVARQCCDRGETLLYDKTKNKEVDEYYWATSEDHIVTSNKLCMLAKHTQSCLFDGGNCKNMSFPPFTFQNLALEKGDTVELLGYDTAGAQVKTYTLKDYGEVASLSVEVADGGLPLRADGNDFVFVYVRALDKDGNTVLDYTKEVSLDVVGGAAVYEASRQAEAGVAAFLARADKGSRKLTLTGSSDGRTVCAEYDLAAK